jgi:putative toxin-antitoxin system antitoxin component (TIGR02293 family)
MGSWATRDTLPRKVWHNVLMSSATHVPSSSGAPFSFDWKAVERGVPLSSLEAFAKYSGFALKDLLEVVIPPRTLKHRRARKEPLSLDESDRLARVAGMYELAVRVFGDRDNGLEWLTGPKNRFEGKTPLAMLRTEAGEHAVREFLIQIDEGYFA